MPTLATQTCDVADRGPGRGEAEAFVAVLRRRVPEVYRAVDDLIRAETAAPEGAPKTVAPADRSGRAALAGGTLSAERPRPERFGSRPRDEPADPTFSVERSAPARPTLSPARPRGRRGEPGGPTAVAGSRGATDASAGGTRLPLDLLDGRLRARVEVVAGAVEARLAGVAPAAALLERVEACLASGERLAERLAADGLADGPAASRLAARTLGATDVCAGCLAFLPLRPPVRCPACGAAFRPAGGEDGPTAAADLEGELAGLRAAPSPGTRLGVYEIQGRLGEGGMGVVFAAHDTSLDRPVALKVLRGGALAAPGRRRRFLQEAEAAATLHHPSIVPVYQVGEEDGYPFYAMELIHGVDLRRHVEQTGAGPREVARLVRDVADAVSGFHRRGIIHRDLKPDNVLVPADRVPRVIDFGIAKHLGRDGDDTFATVEGDVLGTPHYMSPEQAAGRNAEVDTRCDVYALGAILYRLLAGAPPYADQKRAALLAAIQAEDPAPIRTVAPGVDADLACIVETAMAREPERRYASALELVHDLERYLADEPIEARPAGLVYRARKFARRHRVLVRVVAAVLLVVAVGGAALVARERARGAEIARRLREAERAPLAERAHLYSQILGLDPDHATAAAEGRAAQRELAARRAAAERVRVAEERAERERAEARLRELEEERRLERLRAEFQAARERDAARRQAKEEARREAEARVRGLLERAAAAADPLQAEHWLEQARGLLAAHSGSSLRARVAEEQLALLLRLARAEVDRERLGLAEYWLRKAEALGPDAAAAAELEALHDELAELRSGRRLHEEARGLIVAERWLRARDLLARLDPTAGDEVAADRALVAARCREEGLRRLDRGQALLQSGRPLEAMPLAREAARYLADESAAAEALAATCGATIADRARGAAQRLVDQGRAPRALVVLQEAAHAAADTPAAAALERELADRRRLLEDRRLRGFVYVPAVPERGVAACYVARTEATRGDLGAFRAAGGYDDASLWDGVDGDARRALEARRSAGWPGGGAAADLPARGVTWSEARAYARWRARVTGLPVRLPHAAELEVAAGWEPGTRRWRTFPWGDDFAAGRLRLDAQPAPVGSNPRDRSPLGVLDVAGSVCEWVEVDGGPGLKGASAASDPRQASHMARVDFVGRPLQPCPEELLSLSGLRLLVEASDD